MRDVNAGFLQGSILGPLLFQFYINDLSNGLKSNPKLFADDTSLFSAIHDVNSSQIDLNEDLDKINNWEYQWKMSLNPDPSKKAQEVIFNRKANNLLHPPLTFNNVDVGQIPSQKHLGTFLDFKLSFNEHLETVFAKVNRGIAILRQLQTVLPRGALLTIYKSFICPHFDYGDVIYDQSYNYSFHAKLDSYQYEAALVMTGAIKGSSTEKLYQELGIEHLRSRGWFRKLCLFYKIIKGKSPPYLFNLIPGSSILHTTSIFSPEINKFCYIKKYRYRLYFAT